MNLSVQEKKLLYALHDHNLQTEADREARIARNRVIINDWTDQLHTALICFPRHWTLLRQNITLSLMSERPIRILFYTKTGIQALGEEWPLPTNITLDDILEAYNVIITSRSFSRDSWLEGYDLCIEKVTEGIGIVLRPNSRCCTCNIL